MLKILSITILLSLKVTKIKINDSIVWKHKKRLNNWNFDRNLNLNVSQVKDYKKDYKIVKWKISELSISEKILK